MPQQLAAHVSDYYEIAPSSEHAPGDIWSGLPTYGQLSSKALCGIVITPACDLSNRKVETITYLPIIPVRSYFSTIAFLPDVLKEVAGQLEAANLGYLIPLIQTSSHFSLPSPQAIQRVRDELNATTVKRVSEKVKVAIGRASAGIQLIENIAVPEVIQVPMNDLKSLMGEKGLKSILDRIVSNSYRLDVHFLPADQQDPAWSGVPHHSLVLFRYTFSALIEIFSKAHDVQIKDWSSAVGQIATFVPGATAFASERPLKRLTLKPRFLADLLTRYVAMHVRLGSPDFSDLTASKFSREIGEC